MTKKRQPSKQRLRMKLVSNAKTELGRVVYWIIAIDDQSDGIVWHEGFSDSRDRALAFLEVMHGDGTFDDAAYEELLAEPDPDSDWDGSFWDDKIYAVLDRYEPETRFYLRDEDGR